MQDASDLWNADSEQASALFDSMVKKMEQNCLCENRLSSIYCAEARRDPELAKKVPTPPLPQQMPAKQSTKVADKLDSVIAGNSSPSAASHQLLGPCSCQGLPALGRGVHGTLVIFIDHLCGSRQGFRDKREIIHYQSAGGKGKRSHGRFV